MKSDAITLLQIMKVEELFEDLNSRFDYKRDVGIMNNAESIKPSFIRYFMHWLRKEHLLCVFMENYKSSFTYSFNYVYEFVSSAFDWVETSQDWQFWANAHKCWLMHIKNNNKKLELLYGVTEKSN